MTAPELDLSWAVDRMGRELFIAANGAMTPSGFDAEKRESLLGVWNDPSFSPATHHYYRRLALRALSAEVIASIGRQAFDIGYAEAIDRYGTDIPWGGSVTDNKPWPDPELEEL